MITEEKKDFTEAKRVLDELKAYAEGKIAKRNQTNTEAPTIGQEMTLASQPEVVSDHLEEESVLPPLDATVEAVANTGVSQESATADVGTDVTANTLNTGNGAEEAQIADGVAQNDGNKEEISASAPQQVNNGGTADAIASTPTPEPLPQVEMTTATQGTDINNMATSSMDASLESVNSSLNTGTDVALESVPEVSVANGQALANENLQAGTSLDNGSSAEIQPEQVGNGETLIESAPDGLATVNSGPSTVGIPESMGTNIGQGNETIPDVTPQPAIPQIEAIPEISIPGQDMGTLTDNYQASANGAQAVISDITPAVSNTNVVMPTGTTEEEANDQTLVVGPESFTPSR